MKRKHALSLMPAFEDIDRRDRLLKISIDHLITEHRKVMKSIRMRLQEVRDTLTALTKKILRKRRRETKENAGLAKVRISRLLSTSKAELRAVEYHAPTGNFVNSHDLAKLVRSDYDEFAILKRTCHAIFDARRRRAEQPHAIKVHRTLRLSTRKLQQLNSEKEHLTAEYEKILAHLVSLQQRKREEKERRMASGPVTIIERMFVRTAKDVHRLERKIRAISRDLGHPFQETPSKAIPIRRFVSNTLLPLRIQPQIELDQRKARAQMDDVERKVARFVPVNDVTSAIKYLTPRSLARAANTTASTLYALHRSLHDAFANMLSTRQQQNTESTSIPSLEAHVLELRASPANLFFSHSRESRRDARRAEWDTKPEKERKGGHGERGGVRLRVRKHLTGALVRKQLAGELVRKQSIGVLRVEEQLAGALRVKKQSIRARRVKRQFAGPLRVRKHVTLRRPSDKEHFREFRRMGRVRSRGAVSGRLSTRAVGRKVLSRTREERKRKSEKESEKEKGDLLDQVSGWLG